MLLGGLFSKTTCLKLTASLFLALLLTTTPVHAQAQQPVSSPQVTCITPSGEKIVTYADGIHGIVGDFRTFTGRDEVFALGNENTLQCFCAKDGSGVETIWWSSFPEDSVDELTASGWIYVPNGSLWGLEPKPYLAKNTNYTCSADTTSSTGGTQVSDNGGEVLGETLAATGGKGIILALIFSGAFLLSAGIVLKLRFNKN